MKGMIALAAAGALSSALLVTGCQNNDTGMRRSSSSTRTTTTTGTGRTGDTTAPPDNTMRPLPGAPQNRGNQGTPVPTGAAPATAGRVVFASAGPGGTSGTTGSSGTSGTSSSDRSNSGSGSSSNSGSGSSSSADRSRSGGNSGSSGSGNAGSSRSGNSNNNSDAASPAAGKEHADHAGHGATHAMATIEPAKNAKQKVTGTVHFMADESGHGVKVTGDLKGLTPNAKHGFHIHEKADLSDPDLKSAGSHFNPTNGKHGGPDTQQRHGGDLGNVTADAQGNAHFTVMAQGISVGGEKDGVVGRSVVVHEKADDLKTDPAGDSGARIAGGVIKAAGDHDSSGGKADAGSPSQSGDRARTAGGSESGQQRQQSPADANK